MSEGKGTEFHADNSGDESADDGYWAALFRMESNTPNDIPPAIPNAPVPFEEHRIEPVPDQENGHHPPAESAIPSSQPPVTTDPWVLAQRMMDMDQIVELKILGHNKGGLLVAWNGIQGFVPASQLIDLPEFHVARSRIQALSDWQDRVLRLKIIEVNKISNRLIFSERATLVQAEQRQSLLLDVQPGQEREGKITNLTEFGAFVDLGGVEGLVHKSEISWSRVAHPSALLRQGQLVRVLVLKVETGVGRVALSIKRLRPDPWLTAAERYRPGQRVSGIISTITTYGAFVELEEELEGLVHISELAEGVFLHPRDVVTSGDRVVARVLGVDAAHKRIALSLRGVDTPPAARD